MNEIGRKASSLLSLWCNRLLELMGEDGSVECKACGISHGRAFDAIYPFMYQYSITGDRRYLDASLSLFDWAERNVSEEDGSYRNDIDSEWRGTTVFTLIQLIDTLDEFGTLIPEDSRQRIEERALRAACFLSGFEDLKTRNINYPVSNSLAMYLSYRHFGKREFLDACLGFYESYRTCISRNGLLYGEGRPRNGRTAKLCRPIDIGYNLMESIPAIVRLGYETKDSQIIALGDRLLHAHMPFMLSDGAIDNSFGTRSFKWSYYGSRTADGIAAALLIRAPYEKSLASLALENLRMLERCTFSGLLSGGPGYRKAGQEPCIHHSFTNAKTLAFILSHGLSMDAENRASTARYEDGIRMYDEAATAILSEKGMSATVTAYDWEYIKEGHPSGGTLSLLHHEKAGAIAASSMNEYVRKERNNMQEERGEIAFGCTSPRIEKDGLSSIYGYSASLSQEKDHVIAEGRLSDESDRQGDDYSLSYSFRKGVFTIDAECRDSSFILPVVLYDDDCFSISGGSASIERKNGWRIVIEGSGMEDGGEVFSLVPGFICRSLTFPIKDRIGIGIHTEEI